MGFLEKLAGIIVAAVLGWLYKTAKEEARKKEEADKAEADIREDNAAVREQVEKAQTPKEREDALKAVKNRW